MHGRNLSLRKSSIPTMTPPAGEGGTGSIRLREGAGGRAGTKSMRRMLEVEGIGGAGGAAESSQQNLGKDSSRS